MPLTAKEIDCKLSELDARFASLQKQYAQDRETYIRMRDIVQRESLASGASVAPQERKERPQAPKNAPVAKGEKSTRQVIRDVLAGITGDFTMPSAIAEAGKQGNAVAADLDKNTWSSTLFWLEQNKFLKLVTPRQGKTPGVYRVIVSPEELLNPTKQPIVRGYPLQGIVKEGLNLIPSKRFGRKVFAEFVRNRHPEHKERLTDDIVGAVLNRLAANNVGARIVERSAQGNIYEKI